MDAAPGEPPGCPNNSNVNDWLKDFWFHNLESDTQKFILQVSHCVAATVLEDQQTPLKNSDQHFLSTFSTDSLLLIKINIIVSFWEKHYTTNQP